MSVKITKKRPTLDSENSVRNTFDLTGRVGIITGGGGLLGEKHAETVAELGGIPVLVDLNEKNVKYVSDRIKEKYGVDTLGLVTDITSPSEVETLKEQVIGEYQCVDILINNAANNPNQSDLQASSQTSMRLENLSIEKWMSDLSVGLTGAFLCSKYFGVEMARAERGVILNIGSDLGLIGPDQRLYRLEGVDHGEQPVKPITYSVVKTGLIGLTRYLATYWADAGIRANLIAPGGVQTDQDSIFVERLSNLIPLGRMAKPDEYKAAVAFLISDASSYMTGAVLSVDGGRTCW